MNRTQIDVGRGGFALWFTGLSGAGKTTITRILARQLRERGIRLEILDGDVVRANLSPDLGFDKKSRDLNIRRIAFVSQLLVRNGVGVMVAAISPYREERELARSIIGPERFIEVFVDAPLDVCIERDVKGLYAKALSGEIKNFTGVSDPYEAPVDPQVTLCTAPETPEESAARVLAYLESDGWLPVEELQAQAAGA
ncbi:MAG: adenylyl-sulfate kinase [Gemmatimonadetes bacterium]|nr:adenylyl-sulfate kinase [Gemmatimonadota bacterium]